VSIVKTKHSLCPAHPVIEAALLVKYASAGFIGSAAKA